ncbi:MAG: CsbD family protein [Pseudomonadota bacterium]
MNKDIIAGNWKQLKGEVQKQWGKLTDDHMDQINGDRTKLVGSIQKAYGSTKEDVEKQISDWETKWEANSETRKTA